MYIFSLLRIGFVFFVSGVFFGKKNRGKRLARAFKILGPSFIKLGQALSVRVDIVGESIANDLSHLQDKLPPFSSKKARNIIRRQLGKTVDELFAEFDDKAVAAASIAQVHKAKLDNGRQVAVKILRPKIERAFHSDIRLFYSIARQLDKFKSLKRLKLVEVVGIFDSSVKKELDLRLEAAAASELKENCQDDKGVYIPDIFWEYTAQRILVIEWVDGISVSDRPALVKAGYNLENITKNLSETFLNQSFRDGFFHADIHPGNLFIDKNENIVPIDFGIMGRLDKQTRIYVAEILKGFLTGDYEHVAKVHFYAGYVPSSQSEEDFKLACRAIGEPIMGLPASEVSIAKLLALLFKVTADFKMETQPQLILLQKTMVLIEGVGYSLYPEINMWQQAEGWIKKWASQNMGVEAKVKESFKDMASLIKELPDTLRKIDFIIDRMAKEKSEG